MHQDMECRNWVWVPSKTEVFRKGYILEPIDDNKVKVRFDDGTDEVIESSSIEEVNPTKFDKVGDIAELTYLNEPSVLYNLEKRYTEDLIYTYSGLFLVAINPYMKLPMYSDGYVNMYHNVPKADTKPHIFAETEEAYQNLLTDKRDQSILVTGESGAGKTENTKKIIQYLAAITSGHKGEQSFEQQIIQANPILESFGNSQTLRNNNSSRFGKFIKIEFNDKGKIAGARIDWYLLEKSRVVKQSKQERNYHIFYQLLSGLTEKELTLLGLKKLPSAYNYLKDGNFTIPGIDDKKEFKNLKQAMDIMGFEKSNYYDVFKVMAIILHIGNVDFTSMKAEQANFKSSVDKICELLGVSSASFSESILRPKVKAGKELMKQSRKASEAKSILDALSKSLYEKVFKYLVDHINTTLEHSSGGHNFIGVLDIAGFEIFKQNSFEQLCINYTNEKLQQFFNHHMFVLEQNEYLKEDIDWKFIDFGQDLQATIDLIEKKPLGVFSILEEECIVPKASDSTFFNKLETHCKGSNGKFKPSKFSNKFTLKHYAGDVEYSIEQWIEKNRDPLSDSIVEMLAGSKDKFVSALYLQETSQRNSSYRTVSQRHKEELNDLMGLLSQTHPHFVRCIIPNHKKKPQTFDKKLVLEQLKCNGVLEGIRIVRSGFPNRIFFKEFLDRYKVLCGLSYTGNIKDNCKIILGSLRLDSEVYKVGSTKIFFKAGVLAELELKRDQQIKKTLTEFKSICQGVLKRRSINQKLERIQASQVLMKAFRTFNALNQNPWFTLYSDLKPLLQPSQQVMKSKHLTEQIKGLETQLEHAASERESALCESKKHQKELQSKLELSLVTISELEAEQEQLKNSNVELANKMVTHETDLQKAKDLIAVLEAEKNSLSDEISAMESTLLEAKELNKVSKENSLKIQEEIHMLKALLGTKDSKIKDLEDKLHSFGKEYDVKFSALNSSYYSANKSVKQFAEEKQQLADQIKALQISASQYASVMSKKETELQSLKEELRKQDLKVSSLEAGRDRLQQEREKLDSVRSEILSLKSKHKQLVHDAREARDLLQQKISDDITFGRGRQQYDNNIATLKAEISALKGEINEEKSKQANLASRLRDVQTENDDLQRGKKESGVRAAQGTFRSRSLNSHVDNDWDGMMGDKEKLIREYGAMRLQLNEQSALLRKEGIDNKKLRADLKLIHARLASETFDKQQLKIQVKKIKESIGAGDSPIIGDETYDLLNAAYGKLQKENQNLKIELDLERKASERLTARNEPTRRVLQDRNSMNSPFVLTGDSDAYKAKYEASESRLRLLERELMASGLKSREAMPSPPKHDDDLLQAYQETKKQFNSARYEVVQYKTQAEILERALEKSKRLISEYQRNTVDLGSAQLAREELAKAQLRLQAVESKNSDLSKTVNLYKSRTEEYFNKLENAEASMRNSNFQWRFFKEQYDESLAEIEKSKRDCTKMEATMMKFNASISQLKDTLGHKDAEISKLESSNMMLKEEIQQYHERLFNSSAHEKSRLEGQLSKLSGDLSRSLRNETDLRKNIGSLEVDLDRIQSQKNEEIAELIKEKTFFIHRNNDLKEENERSQQIQRDLEVKLRSLMKQIGTLHESVDSLIKERNTLDADKKRLEQQVKELSGEYSKFSNDRDMALEAQNTLKETINKYEYQIESLKSESRKARAFVDRLNSLIDDEKQKNVVLQEENQSLGKFTETLKSRIGELEEKLSVDTDEVWVERLAQLEDRLKEETNEKHEQTKQAKYMARQVDELKSQVDRQSRTIASFDDERSKYNTKISELFNAIQKWQAADSTSKIDLRRAEREVQHLQEQSAGLTQELTSWKEKFDSLTSKKRELPTNEIFI